MKPTKKKKGIAFKPLVNGSVPFSNDELKNIVYAAKLNYGKKIKEEYSKEIQRSYKQWLKIILQLCEQAKAHCH